MENPRYNSASPQLASCGTPLQQLLAAVQRHGAQGPAAALHIASLAAAAIAALRTCSSSSNMDIIHSSNIHQRPHSHDTGFCGGGGGDASSVLRAASAWLADVGGDVTAPEPAARAAMTGLADLLTGALRLMLAAPPAAAAAAAAAAALYEPRCDAIRLTAAAVGALYGRCADAAAVAAAARLLGCCLQLQLQLPPRHGRHSTSAAGEAAAAAPQPQGDVPEGEIAGRGWGMPGAGHGGGGGDGEAGAAEAADSRPVGLSEAAGWVALLELRRHPHPVVRTACLGAVHQACAAAASARRRLSASLAPFLPYAAAAAPAAAAPPPHLLDPCAAAAAYSAAVASLEDDAEEPRAAAAALVSELAVLVPDLSYGTHFGVAARLVDDGFMRLCALVADPQRGLRLQALRALGGLHAASLRVKLQALSKKTTLRVAAPPPAAAATAAAAAAQPAAAAATAGGGGGGRAGGKRPAADAAAAAGAGSVLSTRGAGGGPAAGASAKRLTASAWEPQSSWLTATKSGSGSGSGSGSASRPGIAGAGNGGGGGGGGDLALLENAVGAFVLGSEDEHWEVRAATLDAMTRLAEFEYRTAAAAAVAAAGPAVPVAAPPPPAVPAGTAPGPAESAEPAAGSGAPVAGGTRGGARAGGGGAAAGTAPGLSVRIGGIGGSAGSRIAAGGGNAEAAAAICEALVDALLDELPEVRRAAARGVGRLLRLEVAARRQVSAAEAEATAAEVAAAAAAPSRRGLPPLLNEEGIRTLAAAARDTDGETRRAVVRALGLLRLPRPAWLREVVQALRRCVAANPSAPDWRAAAAAAWRLGAAAPAAAAASVRDLSPKPDELAATPTAIEAAAATAGSGGDTGEYAERAAARSPPPPAPAAAAAADPVCVRRSALRRLRFDPALRLLVLGGAHAVQPEALAAALPPYLTGPLLAEVGRLYRP
ncbi:hypothetical protein PLESTF_000312900 [Pleodorina starrii]|nr:hypothetical protein PLESTF_000312900 [Pleodorina starrii]